MTHQATIRGIGMSVGASGVGAPAVLLAARDEIVPIFVDPGQAQSIQRGRQGIPTERPMTHDLFADTIQDLDATLERIRIDALEDETFYAKLDLVIDRGPDIERFVRDARPSDGIALAVRLGCPITITGDVIDEAGRDPQGIRTDPTETGPGGPLGAGMHTGRGAAGSDVGRGETSESVDLDTGVEIEIDETDEPVEDRDEDPAEEVDNDADGGDTG